MKNNCPIDATAADQVILIEDLNPSIPSVPSIPSISEFKNSLNLDIDSEENPIRISIPIEENLIEVSRVETLKNRLNIEVLEDF